MKIYMLQYRLTGDTKNTFYHQLNKALNIQDSLNLNKFYSELTVLDLKKEYYDYTEEKIRNVSKNTDPKRLIEFYTKLINTWI